jgi:hypothetical protein
MSVFGALFASAATGLVAWQAITGKARDSDGVYVTRKDAPRAFWLMLLCEMLIVSFFWWMALTGRGSFGFGFRFHG